MSTQSLPFPTTPLLAFCEWTCPERNRSSLPLTYHNTAPGIVNNVSYAIHKQFLHLLIHRHPVIHITQHRCMPRIASLYPTHQPPSGSSNNHRRRIDHNSYLHPAPKSHCYGTSRPRFTHRIRTFHRTASKPPRFGQRSQTATYWKSKLSFLSPRSVQQPQPLTLEEKLRVAADRVRRFERPQTRPQTRPQQTRIRTSTQARTRPVLPPRTKAPIRKRDKLQTRLNTFIAGKF